MSQQHTCDRCHKILYEVEQHPVATLRIRASSRYHKGESRDFDLELCVDCELKVALAFKFVLPQVAYFLDPNIKLYNLDGTRVEA